MPVNPEASSSPTKHCCAMVCLMAERVALILPVACKQSRQGQRIAVQFFSDLLKSADSPQVGDAWTSTMLVLHQQMVHGSAYHAVEPQWRVKEMYQPPDDLDSRLIARIAARAHEHGQKQSHHQMVPQQLLVAV